MSNGFSNISKIEDFMWKLLTSDMIKTKYLTELPSLNKSTNAVVIDFPNLIRDKNAFAEGTAVVTIYAKPLKSGFRDPIIGRIESEVERLVSENKDTRYSVSIEGAYSDYDAARDYHARVIILNILVG